MYNKRHGASSISSVFSALMVSEYSLPGLDVSFHMSTVVQHSRFDYVREQRFRIFQTQISCPGPRGQRGEAHMMRCLYHDLLSLSCAPRFEYPRGPTHASNKRAWISDALDMSIRCRCHSATSWFFGRSLRWFAGLVLVGFSSAE